MEDSVEIPIETKIFKIKDYNYNLTNEWRLISYSRSNSIVFKANIKNSSETDSMSIIIKIPKKSTDKNLFYEFLVGQMLNDNRNLFFSKSLFYSFFPIENQLDLDRLKEKLENHELIYYNVNSEILNEINSKKLPEKTMSFKSSLNNNLKVFNILEQIKGFEYNYVHKNENSIFIEEYIGDKVNILDVLFEKKGIENGLIEILNILYIVYANLYKVREIFSHNNLTINKVLLQFSRQTENNYIYEIETKRGKILTRIRPVIIDYSQSYHTELDDMFSNRDIIDNLTKNKRLNKNKDLLFFKQIQDILIENKEKISTTNKTKNLLETLIEMKVEISEELGNGKERDYMDKTIDNIMDLYIQLEDLTYEYNYSDYVNNSLEIKEVKMFY